MSYVENIIKENNTTQGFKYKSSSDSKTSDKENFYKKETIESVLELPFAENTSRGISKKTMETFGVRCGFDEVTGKPVSWYFPSYDKLGNLTGFTKQDTTKTKKERFHWSTVGEVSIENKLFGQKVCEKTQGKRKTLILTEGQWDCLSAYQSKEYSTDKTTWKGLKPFVCSIPMGTLNAKKSILINKKFVNSFDEMIVHFDDDYCTEEELKKGIKKGLEACNDVVQIMSDETTRVKVFSHEEPFKDASDYLQAGVTKGNLDGAMDYLAKKYWNSVDAEAEKIVKASNFDIDLLLKPLEKGINIVDFPKLDDMLFGIRPRECTVLTAGSGSGKTTIASKLAESAKKQGKRIGNIYLEESADKTMQRYLASELGVGFKEFRRNPLNCGFSREQITDVFNKLVKKDDLILLDHFGSMPITELMSKIKYMHVVEGCDLIIVDHLSMVISGSDVKDERKELDMVMTQIASFCESYNVHVMLIVHINRKNGEGQLVPKDKEGNEKPYWIRINLTSLRGSAGIEQMANNVIALESEQLPNRKRGRVRFVVLKNREGGELGEADYFKINPVSWDVELCSSEGESINVDIIPNNIPRIVNTSKLDEDVDLPF